MGNNGTRVVARGLQWMGNSQREFRMITDAIAATRLANHALMSALGVGIRN
jgi:hypothetical protein